MNRCVRLLIRYDKLTSLLHFQEVRAKLEKMQAGEAD